MSTTLNNSAGRFFTINAGVSTVANLPEPASLALLGVGLAGLAVRHCRVNA